MTQPKRVGVWEDPGFLDVCDAKVARLFQLWNDKRGTRAMPARGDLDVLELREWIGSIALFDVLHDPLDFRYRLFGSKIAAALGRDLTGRKISEEAVMDDHANALVALRDLIGRRTYRFRNDIISGARGGFLGRDRVYLPLSQDGERIDMLLLYFADMERVL